MKRHQKKSELYQAPPSDMKLDQTGFSLRRLLRVQFFSVVVILLVELFMRSGYGGYSVIVISLLATVMYIALTHGLKQAVVSAVAITIYNFYLVANLSDMSLLSWEGLRRGVVVAIVFPTLAIIVGRLKERNDSLLRRERAARKEAEENEKQLRFMAESMPQKIFTNAPDGTSDYANPQWEEYTGKKSSPGKIYDWSTLIHPNDLYENKQLWRHSIETGEPFQYEHRLKRADGKYRWHLTRSHAAS